MDIKPEKIWKLFEIEGFQILVQMGYYDDGDDDKHYFQIMCPVNSVMVTMALGFPREELAQDAFDTIIAERALESLRKFAFGPIVGGPNAE